MAYTFVKENVGSFKFNGATDQSTLNLTGINATLDADTVIYGINGLLYIAGRQNDFDALTGIRTVKEDVDED